MIILKSLYIVHKNYNKYLNFSVEWLIVDEVDKLFEDGIRCFRDQFEKISKSCTSEKLHKAMFSATNTPIVTKWCRHNLKGLITVTVGHRFKSFFLNLKKTILFLQTNIS